LTVGGRLPKHPSVSQLTSLPDSVLSKCRRSRHPIPTQIATAPAASNRFLRRSRYQGDIIETSTPVSPPVFPELRAPLHRSADRFDATPGTAAIGHFGMGKVMVKHKSH